MTDATLPAMQQLRDSTREEHQRAEHHEFQQALVKGELSRDRYAAWLAQMYRVHDALETAVCEATQNHEAVRNVVREYQYQVPYLLEDLDFLGIDPTTISPLPATARFTAIVEHGKEDPLQLLGLHYVLEGSNNGSRHIARHVAKAYELAPGPGLRYLDPYGDRQREYWMAFKTDMGAAGFSGDDVAKLVAAAKQMYRTVAELSDDLAAKD